VVVDGVSKTFAIPQERVHTLKEHALHPFRRTRNDVLHALRDVSFAVEPGEFFGIVGRNGSGKSTLLKCLAGIYAVDSGHIYVNGRMATFIELGVGFNPDLAARDNILLNAIMLGLSPSEARERVERVLDFAELNEFRELKLKNYSSGMQVRLAFSVMIQVNADILLIDEVLAVGDAAFQQKCFDEFNRLRDEGRTILFVTHDMSAVTRFCHRAMLLERGDVASFGDPQEVARDYIKLNFPEQAVSAGDLDVEHLGDRSAYVVEVWFEDEHGDRHEYLPQGSRCCLKALIRFQHPTRDPSFGASIKDESGKPVFSTSTIWTREETGVFSPGDQAVFAIGFENLLMPGRYYATVEIANRGSGDSLIDQRDRAATMVSTGGITGGGVVNLPHETAVSRMPSSVVEETPW
jgi:ABC-type polysaccharide/polyol phosphate transport system ATPase subunit